MSLTDSWELARREPSSSYQLRRGLPVDGTVTQTVLASLEDELRRRPSLPIATTPPQPEPQQSSGQRIVEPSPRRPISVSMPSQVSTSSLGPADLFEKTKSSVWLVISAASIDKLGEEAAQGSAVAVSRTEVITNCHVVGSGRFIGLVQGTTVLRATLTDALPGEDRCVLRTEASLTPVQAVRTFKDLRVGERVYTIGAPRGLERTLGDGLISGLRAAPAGNFIQTTAPISPGSSGGGLFDERGNLIGITTFLLRSCRL